MRSVRWGRGSRGSSDRSIGTLAMKRTIVFLSLLLVGCGEREPRDGVHFYSLPLKDGRSPFPVTLKSQLAALTNADPIEDAKRAYRRGDHRLAAALGIDLIVPGLQIESTQRLLGPMRLLGVKIISGTTDSLENDEHLLMNQRAWDYAKSYKAQMIILLTTHGRPRPE